MRALISLSRRAGLLFGANRLDTPVKAASVYTVTVAAGPTSMLRIRFRQFSWLARSPSRFGHFAGPFNTTPAPPQSGCSYTNT